MKQIWRFILLAKNYFITRIIRVINNIISNNERGRINKKEKSVELLST